MKPEPLHFAGQTRGAGVPICATELLHRRDRFELPFQRRVERDLVQPMLDLLLGPWQISTVHRDNLNQQHVRDLRGPDQLNQRRVGRKAAIPVRLTVDGHSMMELRTHEDASTTSKVTSCSRKIRRAPSLTRVAESR